MIKIDKVKVNGFKDAARGMRNSFNSWAKGDSDYVDGDGLGIRDVELMKRLAAGGSSHAKFRRFITVTCDILAPLYWWKEFDTYKVGTVANSCSTMHTITEKEFEWEDFSFEHLGVHVKNTFDYPDGEELYQNLWVDKTAKVLLEGLNQARCMYLREENPDVKKQYWWQIIQLLPASYNQKRTVLLNYEVLSAMYNDRKHHKLDEWRDFCEWIEALPYAEGLIFPELTEEEKLAAAILMGDGWDFAKN